MADQLEIRPPRTPSEREAAFHLRWRILRERWQQPPGSERDDLDADEEASFLVVAVDAAGQVWGTGRLHRLDATTGQIRYMAVDPRARGRSVGRAILDALEAEAVRWGLERLVLNAREGVVGFYQRAGYVIRGPAPTLFGVIPHHRMEKSLAQPARA
ncbi:MAG: GNAT family acetyltransferase YiiD potentially involved in tRNA processing [Candidatus Ozemobacter sibiricus]|jgi:GNAT superfamily N-acetyltransferase|uniref:GNAT family acetyltransferase YiiD potentially involved in tRNA processing n=1 Tax=Candidatus Ozemobacter sibiricus TaxID=2268124 RepID=A0A367ZD27_9BACT|nr:MAG: GNAT family acetyltransferase YiiD potentially involved in tRNA processing [Candidatus Ozemobacter sibiricus]